MVSITVKCKDKGALELFDFLAQKEGLPEARFDQGYPIINYRKVKVHTGERFGAGDGAVQCEEIWETALATLDEWGEAAHWKEEIDTKSTNMGERKSIERYQKLRSLIEGTTQRPIPWVLNSPTTIKPGQEQKKSIKAAQKIRENVNAAIAHLKEKILIDLQKKIQEKKLAHDESWKQDDLAYQKALVAGLFWFALTPKEGGDVSEDTPASLLKYRIGHFEDYLRKHGGLGLARIKIDAPLEATALETLEGMRGLCTEQSKVLFAVLRMAGIKAHFIEPRLSIDYYFGHKNERIRRTVRETIPLLGHVASGVAIEIKNGHPEPLIWILDPALQMLEPDYAEDKKPYWILSLRHFLMMDLGILAGKQIKLKMGKKAQETFEHVFRLGHDSTAYDAYANYTQFLKQHPNTHLPDIGCVSVDECAQIALDLYPYEPVIHYNYGLQLTKRAKYQDALSHFLTTIELDPRFPNPRKEIFSSLQRLRRIVTKSDLQKLRDETIEKLEKIKENHTSLGKELVPLSRLIDKLRRIK